MLVPLTLGFYEARSINADAQRCINLFIEQNPPDSPYPYTHYPTPGLAYETTAPNLEAVRGMYTASNGSFYVVVGSKVYVVSSSYVWTQIGTLTSSTGPVSLKDNTLACVIVDGTTNGYVIRLSDNAFSRIVATPFYGSNRVDYLDTYFIFNRPGTQDFYISLSEVSFENLTGGPIETGALTAGGAGYVDGTYNNVPLTQGHGTGATANIAVNGGAVTSVTIVDAGESYRVGDTLTASNADLGGTGTGFIWRVSTVGSSSFDPLDLAAKSGGNDLLNVAAVMHREIWLIGLGTSEVWYNSGATDFTFQAMPGAFIEHGCQAGASVAKWDLVLYWLGQDSSGNSIVFRGAGYRVERISTHAIEKQISSYAVKSDAIGFTYLQEGHVFYVLTFPTESVTWVYDETEKHWHQRAWQDNEGNFSRWRANCCAVFNNKILVGDYENGNLYSLDLDTYEDNGNPIIHVRSFPHILNDGKRVVHRSFIASMEVGDPLTPGTTDAAQVSLRYSDTAGRSYGNAITQTLGATGEYYTSIQFNRLGYARDRVYELSWSAPMKTSLSGAWIQVVPEGS